MSEPRRLVAVAWQRPGTGMTRVADRLLGGLGGEWRVDVAGVGYGGPTRTDGALTVHPSDHGGRDVFAAHAAAELCRGPRRPDAVLVHNDLWLLPRYAEVVGPHLDGAPLLAYLPLDGEPKSLPTEILTGLEAYDGVALYTRWACAAIGGAMDRAGLESPTLATVPHGVDVDRFTPAAPIRDRAALREGRTRLKRRLFPDLDDPEGVLLVLNANRPDVRKRVDLSLEAFARLVHLAPAVRARLVLHHAFSTPETARALRARAEGLGIESFVVFEPFGPSHPVTDGELATLMAACEIGLNTSMGEGWGLLAFEHAATGAAQVLGRHSAHVELWDGAAVLVEPSRRSVGRSSPLEMAELDPDDVGSALARLEADRSLLHEISCRCRERATDPAFGWKVAQEALRGFLEGACQPS